MDLMQLFGDEEGQEQVREMQRLEAERLAQDENV